MNVSKFEYTANKYGVKWQLHNRYSRPILRNVGVTDHEVHVTLSTDEDVLMHDNVWLPILNSVSFKQKWQMSFQIISQ